VGRPDRRALSPRREEAAAGEHVSDGEWLARNSQIKQILNNPNTWIGIVASKKNYKYK
jgi:hypothetical protein